MVNLNEIAEEINELDFSGVSDDDFDEACYLVAQDLFELNDEEARKVVDIIQEKFY